MEVENRLSALTSIPIKFIDQFKNDLNLIYSDEIYQQFKKQVNPIEVNTLDGKIYLEIDKKDEISFKFVPNQCFIDTVLKVFKEKKSGLDDKLDKRLKVVLQNTYKGLF